VLTKCLVKYALKELLEGKTADEILHLTIMEPAMGSAAFLNEAITQLAEAYLDRKQKETGKEVSHEKRSEELQRIKTYIADRNVYGIDLNPIAVELAEVSLWLNTIFGGGYVLVQHPACLRNSPSAHGGSAIIFHSCRPPARTGMIPSRSAFPRTAGASPNHRCITSSPEIPAWQAIRIRSSRALPRII
jgi:hypothetical protein